MGALRVVYREASRKDPVVKSIIVDGLEGISQMVCLKWFKGSLHPIPK